MSTRTNLIKLNNDNNKKKIKKKNKKNRTVGPLLAASLEPLAHR